MTTVNSQNKKKMTEDKYMELPAAFEEKMRALLQEEFDDYIAC